MLNRLVQPTGSSADLVNKQSIARLFGIKESGVENIQPNVDVGQFKVLFDETGLGCYSVGKATGVVDSYSLNPDDSINLVTSTGSYNLPRHKTLPELEQLVDSQFIFTPETFRSETITTDDSLFETMFAALQALDVITNTKVTGTVRIIDFKGKTYTLTKEHQLDGFIGMRDGTIYCNGGRVVLGRNLKADNTAGNTRRHAISNMHFEYIGKGIYNYALLELCRAFNTTVDNCNFYGGTGGNRARYGLYCGSVRAWGVRISGGHYYGGQCALRLGSTGDHTGCYIGGGLTVDHASVANVIVCNPAGLVISGCNIEHADAGAIGLGITSDTNGSSNVARNVVIEGVYFYNNGSGSAEAIPSDAAVQIGYDIPNTLGWDAEGVNITSSGSARHIRISECELISPKCVRMVKMRGLFGLKVENNAYLVKTGESYAFLFEGTCGSSICQGNRNQSSGVFDEFEWKSANPILRNYSSNWYPKLAGDITAGSNTYMNQSGYYTVANGVCSLSGAFELKTVDASMEGKLFIDLPLPARYGYRAGCGINSIAITSTVQYTVTFPDSTTQLITDTTVSVTGVVFSNSTRLNLYIGSSKMTPANVKVTTALHFSISYPVTAGTYTGS